MTHMRIPIIASFLFAMFFTFSTHADSLFPVKTPYECIAAARFSRADDTTRRSDLADCMTKVDDTVLALRLLYEAGTIGADYDRRRLIERAYNSGQYRRASALLNDWILQIPYDAALDEKRTREDQQRRQQELCLSYPERSSPERDRACSGVVGFKPSGRSAGKGRSMANEQAGVSCRSGIGSELSQAEYDFAIAHHLTRAAMLARRSAPAMPCPTN